MTDLIVDYTRLKQNSREPLTREELEDMRLNPWNSSEQLERVRHQLLDVMDALEGCIIVPAEPTEYMISAGMMFQGTDVYSRSEIVNIYKDMIGTSEPYIPAMTHADEAISSYEADAPKPQGGESAGLGSHQSSFTSATKCSIGCKP